MGSCSYRGVGKGALVATCLLRPRRGRRGATLRFCPPYDADRKGSGVALLLRNETGSFHDGPPAFQIGPDGGGELIGRFESRVVADFGETLDHLGRPDRLAD